MNLLIVGGLLVVGIAAIVVSAIGDHKQLGVVEQGGNIAFVCLQLPERVPNRRVLVDRVLELEESHRQAI